MSSTQHIEAVNNMKYWHYSFGSYRFKAREVQLALANSKLDLLSILKAWTIPSTSTESFNKQRQRQQTESTKPEIPQFRWLQLHKDSVMFDHSNLKPLLRQMHQSRKKQTLELVFGRRPLLVWRVWRVLSSMQPM